MRTIINFCKALMRDPLLWGACALLAVGTLMPAVVPSRAHGIADQRSEIEQRHNAITKEIANGGYAATDDPGAALQLSKARAEGEALAATDSRSFYEAAAEVARIDLEEIKKGYLSYDELVARADFEYSRAMADYGKAAPASSTSELTLFEGATVSVAYLPSVAWFLPVLILVARALAKSQEGHLFEAPTRSAGGRAALVFAPLAAGAVAIPLAVLVPALVLFGVMNGIGGAAQPITYVVGKNVEITTMGTALGLTLLFIMLSSLFLAALATLFFRLTGQPAVGVAGAALVAALPMFSGYFDASGPLAGTIAFLPSTYCAPASFIPSAGFTSYLVMQCQADINPVAGAAGLLTGTALLLVASALADRLALPRLALPRLTSPRPTHRRRKAPSC